jgi:prolyl-tRNA editing enzyme YbaK/EbsC (Cys-tRNA(Pro) deacylase)
MNLYHIAASDDAAAGKLCTEIEPLVTKEGGSVHPAFSHGHGEAYVVVVLPDDSTLELDGAKHFGRIVVSTIDAEDLPEPLLDEHVHLDGQAQ